jgi:hypothetical protein
MGPGTAAGPVKKTPDAEINETPVGSIENENAAVSPKSSPLYAVSDIKIGTEVA